jgi:asparagine synthase (glutamine-hydrolysing)
MNTVLACGGMEPNWLQGDDVTPLGGLDALPQPLDEPPYAWNLAPSLAVQQRASQHGRVLLDGLFGDNALCSYPDFHLAELLREGRLVSSMRLVRQYSSHHPGRGWNELKAYGLRPLMPKGVMAAWRRLRGSAGAAEARSEALVRLDFAKRIGIEARRSQLLARFQVPFTSARQLHLFELTAGIATAGFELSDAAAASVGVEPRYPFTDRRLVELSFSVPSEQKFVDGWPRSLLRRGMAGVLPDPIRWRRGKRGTGAWLAANLVADRARIESTLERNVDRIAAYVDPAAVKALLQGYLRDPTAASAAQLWAPLVLAEWLERTAA